METEDTQGRPRGKGIYLLPNLMTTGCLFSGFYAIVAAIDHHFAQAGMAVFVAMIFDTLDGPIACVRMKLLPPKKKKKKKTYCLVSGPGDCRRCCRDGTVPRPPR